MKILYSWLKDYVDFDQTPEKLSDDLTMFAHDVESIDKISNNDAILDLEITPNRGDCLSHLGIARQIAAMYDKIIRIQESITNIKETQINSKIKIKISDAHVCPRYTARIIENIKIEDSPKWMQKRLNSYGFRPINNVVDITNYVMIAIGQPMHAFDYDKIKNGEFNIRLSEKDEEIITLDGKHHLLDRDTIIINDADKIYDLAGIMGGFESEIDSNTKTIVLQAAIFDPVLIRRSSKKLHCQTDASYRYERGVDPEATVSALNMASLLLKESSPEAKFGELIDLVEIEHVNNKIKYNFNKINRLIGTKLSEKEIKIALEKLYFKVDGDIAIVPSFRSYDVTIWQDLAEEVARVYGYNKIDRLIPSKEKSSINKKWSVRESVKDILVRQGFNEIYSYSFVDKNQMKLLGIDINKCLEIVNPISPEAQYLRTDLTISLLNAIAKNPWAPEINIFEIEKVFTSDNEKWQLGIATVGKSDYLFKQVMNVLQIKSTIINIDQNILNKFKIRRQVNILLIDLEDINIDKIDINNSVSNKKYKIISKYPPTIRDLALIVDDSIISEDIEKDILGASSAVILTETFDEYKSDKFGRNKKNIALHIWLQNINSPVLDEDANKIINDIINKIEIKYNAKLRS